jgi:hypothetical protein
MGVWSRVGVDTLESGPDAFEVLLHEETKRVGWLNLGGRAHGLVQAAKIVSSADLFIVDEDSVCQELAGPFDNLGKPVLSAPFNCQQWQITVPLGRAWDPHMSAHTR